MPAFYQLHEQGLGEKAVSSTRVEVEHCLESVQSGRPLWLSRSA